MQQAWFRLTVFYWMDPKFSGLGTRHEALYARLLGYTVAHDTDGLIPANAVALCGRGIYKREETLQDLISAGLLQDAPLSFPDSWQKYQRLSKESAGQKPALGRRGEEKRRVYIDQLEDQLAPGELVEVKDPRLSAVLDRLAHKMNGSSQHG